MPAMTSVDADAPAGTAGTGTAGAAGAGAGTPAEVVGPLVRGVAVLRRLTEAGGTLSPSALERATGLARSTVDRITGTLSRMGYVRADGRDIVLAPRVMELGNAYLAALRLPALLDARADALADELDESVSLAVPDLDGIRFIHQATRRRALSVSFRIGDLLPAERTAPGALFATEWTGQDWTRWREHRSGTARDAAFFAPAPARRTHGPRHPRRHLPGAGGAGPPGRLGAGRPADRAGPGGGVGTGTRPRHRPRGLRGERGQPHQPALRGGTCAPACCPGCVRRWRRWRPTCARRLRYGRARPRRPSRPGRRRPSTNSAGTSWSHLARGLTVLTAFGEGRPALTLSDVARATGLSRATARRALLTHEHLGLVAARPDRTFVLTPRVLDLGFPPQSRTSLPAWPDPTCAPWRRPCTNPRPWRC